MGLNQSKLEALINNGMGSYVPKFKETKGNMFKTFVNSNRFEVMLLNINCFNAMGAGYLKVAEQTFPEISKALANTKAPDISRLGKFMDIPVKVGDKEKRIILLFGQYAYGESTARPEDRKRSTGLIELDKLSSAVGGALTAYPNARICMPRFGLGKYKTEFSDISSVLDHWLNKFPKVKLTVYGVDD